MKSFKWIRKRPLMLLEAMLAFALVVLCVFPLITPHVAMLRAERQFINKVDLDHQVNLLYASVLEQLYKNEIDWTALTENHHFPIPKELTKGYEGDYSFQVDRYKPRDLNATYHLYRLTLTFNFIPAEFMKKSDEVKEKNSLKYSYKVFLVRDRR